MLIHNFTCYIHSLLSHVHVTVYTSLISHAIWLPQVIFGGGVTVYLKHWSITYVPCLVVEQLQFHCIIEFVSQLGLVSWRKWIQPSSIFQYYNVFGLAHNTIHIPNIFLRDWQYYGKYSQTFPHSNYPWMFHVILSAPHNTIYVFK